MALANLQQFGGEPIANSSARSFLFFFVQPKVMALDDGDTFYCCDMSITFGEKEGGPIHAIELE